MKRSLPLVCLAALGCGLLFARDGAPAEPAVLGLAPDVSDRNCKPGAPIRVELEAGPLVGGRAEVDYTLTPVMDALAVDVSIEFPRGGELRWHTPPSRAAAQRGTARRGSLAAELPAGLSGVELLVRAHVSIPDPDAPDGIGTYTTTRAVTWGEVDRVVEGVTAVESGGALTLDTPATRR